MAITARKYNDWSFHIMEPEENTTKTTETEPTETEQEESTTVDSDKVVEKLQHRLGKEQADKNNLAKQLEEANKKLEALQKSKGDVKDLSEKDKKVAAEKEKDDQIKQLQDQLKLTNAKVQTNEVLKEAGLSVSSELLDMIVSTDDEKTYANTKAQIDFANAVQDAVRKEYLTGTTPKDTGNTIKNITETDFGKMTYDQKAKLQKDNPDLFKKMTGGL